MSTIMITGISGMVGSHMAEWFYNRGKKTIGMYYNPTININEIQDKSILIECDVRYFLNVYNLINLHRPEKIFHLAAQSYPAVSWERPQETMDINVNGTINVFEAIKYIRKNIDATYDPMVVVACSSAEYGASLTPENIPVKETTDLLPLHPYGVSKVGQDLLSYQYFVNDEIRSIRARIFNTTGPRKVNDVSSDFTKRAVEIEKYQLSKTLRVGNIHTKRAITDVRDLVNALILLSDKGKPGEAYNISGSHVYEIKEIIEIIEDYMGVNFELEVDKSLLRPTDEPIILGDSTKLIRDTGWEQTYTLQITISEMIEYWRSQL